MNHLETSLTGRMDRLETSLNSRIEHVQQDLAGVKADLVSVKERLSRIEGWVAGRFREEIAPPVG